MIKKLVALLAGLCFACGGEMADVEKPDVERIEIGQTGQAVYLPSLYGMETPGSGATCDSDWENDECLVPNSKTFYVGFEAGTCSSWWQARFVDAWYEMLAEVDYLNSMIHEDATPWYMGPIPELWGEPLVQPGLTYKWRCQATGGIGSFEANNLNLDFVDAGSRGDLAQYKGGVVRIDTPQIEANPLWAASDDARRRRMARNVLRHELWHMFGHGHENNGLMGGGDFWNNEYWPTTDMYDRQACYNPANGGLFADC